MPPWQNTLSIGADDVGFHSTLGRPIAVVPNQGCTDPQGVREKLAGGP